MGLWDRMRGVRRPASGTVPVAATELRRVLLEINEPSLWYRVRPAGQYGVDLIAEAKLADPEWREFFAAQPMSEVFRTYVGFDARKRAVRATNRLHVVREVDGRREYGPVKSMESESMPGMGTYAGRTWVREDGHWVPAFGTDSSEARAKLASATTSLGWTWRGWGLRL